MNLLLALLFAGAWIGHTALLSFSINWWYGHRLPHLLLTSLRYIHFLFVFVGLAAFAWAWWLGVLPWVQINDSSTLQMGAGGYTLACIFFGCVVVPAITVYRLLRPRPAAWISTHSRVVDAVLELGYKPIGHGHQPYFALLPFNQLFQVELSEKTFAFEKLPIAWDGLKILHITDLHFHGTPDKAFYQLIMEHCNAWDADILAVTGDVVDSPRHHSWILPILGNLRYRMAGFAILGNHDSYQNEKPIRQRLKRLGLRVLGNGWDTLQINAETLVVIGHEGPWFYPEPDLTGCPQGAFRLCLSHTPDNIRWIQRQNVDLALAGHNHGGQIRFPIIGSVIVPSKYGRKYDGGVYDERPTLLHVGRGLAAQHPIRFNCRPEVTLITLRAKSCILESGGSP